MGDGMVDFYIQIDRYKIPAVVSQQVTPHKKYPGGASATTCYSYNFSSPDLYSVFTGLLSQNNSKSSRPAAS